LRLLESELLRLERTDEGPWPYEPEAL
jgi:hypothetical protein